MEQSYFSLKTAEGYTAHILRAGDTYGAIVMDNTISRCCQVFKVPVKFGFPLFENDMIPLEINPKHVHLLCANGQRVLFIGRLGLHGGGQWHSCSEGPCSVYHCTKCYYTCPNSRCAEYCGHISTHNCAQRVAEKEERQRKQELLRQEAERRRREQEEKEKEAEKCEIRQTLKEAVADSERTNTKKKADIRETNCDSTIETVLYNRYGIFPEVDIKQSNSTPLLSYKVLQNFLSNFDPSQNRFIDDIDKAKSTPNTLPKTKPQITVTCNTSAARNRFLNQLNENIIKHNKLNDTDTSTTLKKVEAFKKLRPVVEKHISKVDASILQTIMDYALRGGVLQKKVVKKYPVFKWVEQSLVLNIVLFSSIDSIDFDTFRKNWMEITLIFNWEQRIKLLYDLETKQTLFKLTLSQINEITALVLHSRSEGLNILTTKSCGWYCDLKRLWLLPRLQQFSSEQRDALLASLIDLPWSITMTKQLLRFVNGQTNVNFLLELLKLIQVEGPPFSLVMYILLNTSQSEWTIELTYYVFVRKISLKSQPLARQIYISIGNRLRTKSIFHLLEQLVTKHYQHFERNVQLFGTILERFLNYKLLSNAWEKVLNAVVNENNVDNWLKLAEETAVGNIFNASREYETEELIEKIDITLNNCNSRMNLSRELRLYYNSQTIKGVADHVADPISYLQIGLRLLNTINVAGIKRSGASIYEKTAVVVAAAQRCHKFVPRTTQILSILILLNSETNKGRLLQINTGEGKSIIVAILAAIHAIGGKKVDVVTTSTELSKREVERQRAFFEMLQLTVDENSSGRDKKTIYNCDVVYGTASDFQGDILRTEFLGNDCRGNRKFEVVIVDEVDSMLFDSRSHSVRLADQCPGMTHLEVPLAVVWQFIHHTNQHMISKNDKVYFIAEDFEVHGHDVKLLSGEDWLTAATEVDDKKEFIIEHGQKHLQKLLRELAEDEKCEYQTYQDLNLKILAKEQEISLDSSNDQLKKECDKLRAELFQLPWNRRHPIIDIPEHLRAFALTQIPSWIKNAIQAAWGFQRDAHYAVMNGKIVPINFKETGVLQSNMVWSDGLTQFLQLKEGLCMDPEAVSTNFISNVSFFNRYGSNVFGLTGTLGEESTQQFLRSMYGTDMVIIPPYKQVEIHNNQDSPYRCKELMSLVCPNVEMWYKTIKENALYHASSNRGVLIIWQYIFQVEHICNMLKKVYDPEKIHKYTGTDATFDKTTIDSGEIILATNIAGRGTDFKTSQEVENHGGMCVIVTFLPESNRVEMQNVGRTAREGKRGMAQLIVHDKDNTPMETLKTLRSLNETEADEKATDEAKRMLVQDALFQRFCTLENKFLPGHDVVRNVQLWNLLQINWAIFSSDHLNARKIAEESTRLESKTIQQYFNKMMGKKLEKLTKEEIDTTVSEEVASMKPKFEALYIQSKRNEFCQQQSSHMPKELIDCFRANKAYEPFITKDACDFKWTLYDRKGAEESWGMWLKSKHFVENEATEDQATKMFEEEFVKEFETRAKTDQLIRNPFFYVLKGNDALDRKDVEAAINCYDRAIQLDATFSVNARYNKAQALLTYEENKLSRQNEAKEELNKAKDMIAAVYRPSLLTFNTLISQGTCSECASQHVQHQLNILSKQEEYIVRALEMLDQALENENNVKLTLKKLPTVLSEAKEDHGKAIQEASQNGLTHLFMVEEELPRPWGSIISIAFIGITQIAAGCLIVACTGGALGTGLITEGVSDMITSVRSAITGTFSWAAWAAQKVISLAVSIVCAGFSGIKSGMKAVVNTVKDLRKGVQMGKGGIELAVKEVGLAIGKGIVKECLTEGSKYVTDLTIMNKIEETISQKVGEQLTAALLKNDLIVAALQDDETNGSNYWKQKFISDGLDILKDERMNECLRILKEIAEGIATRKIPFASDILTYSGVLVFLKKLMTYTEDFIIKFNKQVSKYRNEINSKSRANSNPQQTTPQSILISQTQQQTLISNAPNVDVEAEDIKVHTLQDDTSYSSKCTFGNKQLQSNYVEASTPESLANAFKSRIAGKLAASARESIVNPALSNATSFVTTKLFTSCEKSVTKLRKEIKTARDKRSSDNDLANTGRKRPDNENKQHKQEDLGEHSKKAIKELSTEGNAHDTSILSLAAAETNRPIYVYDEKGNLKDVLGDNLSGEPISLIHSPPSEENPLGHFEPLNPNVEVTPSGINTCAFDSVFAQLSQEQKDSLKLNDPSDLRERLVQRINSNPVEAERAFSKRAELNKIASDRILRGGARKLPSEVKRKKQTKEQFDDRLHEMDYESDSHTVDEAVEQKKCQKHHILHRKFKNHPALVKANFHIDDPSNLIYLPISKEIRSECGTQRSIHRGRHSKLECNRVKNGLDKINQDAVANHWSQQETFDAVFCFVMDGRTGLRKGIIDLYEKEQREE